VQEHENWLAEQKRHIAALRVQKALAKETPMGNQLSNYNNDSMGVNTQYDPSTGLKMCWDYAINLPIKKSNTKLLKCSLAYILYKGLHPFTTSIKRTSFYETEPTSNGLTNLCIFAGSKKFPKVSPLQEFNMILELKYTGEEGPMRKGDKGKSLGWVNLPLFVEDGKRQDPSLFVGNYKLALNPGSFKGAESLMAVEKEKEKKEEGKDGDDGDGDGESEEVSEGT